MFCDKRKIKQTMYTPIEYYAALPERKPSCVFSMRTDSYPLLTYVALIRFSSVTLYTVDRIFNKFHSHMISRNCNYF